MFSEKKVTSEMNAALTKNAQLRRFVKNGIASVKFAKETVALLFQLSVMHR